MTGRLQTYPALVTRDETLARLRELLPGWPEERLEELDLSGATLATANLRGADLRGADLSGAYFIRADLRDADLRGANLRGADLRGADLSGAYLYEANLSGANLSDADIAGATIQNANFTRAVLPDSRTFEETLGVSAKAILDDDMQLDISITPMVCGLILFAAAVLALAWWWLA